MGRSIRLIIPPDRQFEEDNVLARIRRGESVAHFETLRLRKDGYALARLRRPAQDTAAPGLAEIARRG